MTSQDLTNLAHESLTNFRKELGLRPNDVEYGTSDMLCFYKQAYREALHAVSEAMNDGKNLIEEFDEVM